MKTKSNLLLFALIVVTAVFMISFVSALDLEVTSVPSSVSHNVGNINIQFTLTNTQSTTQSGLVWTRTTNIGQWTNIPTITSINAGDQIPLTATINIPKHSTGTIQASLTVRSNSGIQDTLTVNIPINNEGSLEIVPERINIKSGESVVLDVKNAGNVNLNQIKLSQTGDFTISLSEDIFALAPGNTKKVTATASDLSKLKFGTNSVLLTARDDFADVSDTSRIENVMSFCRNGEQGGNLQITNIEIDNKGDGDDEDWKLLDIIEVTVEVENDGDDDEFGEETEVHLALFDSAGKNQANDLDFENTDEDEIELGDIDEGDDEEVTFRFKVPADFDDGNYKLAVKAFSSELGENNECTDRSDDLDNEFYQSINIEREDDEGKFIAFDNIEIRPTEEVTCGDSVTIDVEIFNIGDKDQDQIRVNLFNSELGLRLEREIRQDLDQGDSEDLSFIFIVPSGLQDKLYTLELDADYDYRSGSYRESSDETTKFGLRVIGCSLTPGEIPGGSEGRIAFISASLDSDAKAGQDLIVKASITGLVKGEADYVVRATGFESWATLKSISERLVHLAEGESKDVTIALNVNNGVSDSQTFTIETLASGKLESREVEVNFGERSGIDLGGNGLIWIIGIINIILIVLIVVVAIRISRR